MPAKEVLALPFYANKNNMLGHVFHHSFDVATGKEHGLSTARMPMSERYANALMNVYHVKSKL